MKTRISVTIEVERNERETIYSHDYIRTGKVESDIAVDDLTRDEALARIGQLLDAAAVTGSVVWALGDLTAEFEEADRIMAEVEATPVPLAPPAFVPGVGIPAPDDEGTAGETPLGETIDAGSEADDDKVDWGF